MRTINNTLKPDEIADIRIKYKFDPDVQRLCEALEVAQKELRTPQWHYDDDGQGVDPVDAGDDYKPGAVFALCGARDTGLCYFKVVDDDGYTQVVDATRDEFEAKK